MGLLCWWSVWGSDLGFGCSFFWWRRLVPGELDDLENYYDRDVYGVNSNWGVFHIRGLINYMLGRIRSPLNNVWVFIDIIVV